MAVKMARGYSFQINFCFQCYKVSTKSRMSSTTSKHSTAVRKSAGADVENPRKKPKSSKVSGSSNKVLSTRNDVAAKCKSSLSQAVKRTSDQMKGNRATEQDEEFGCSQPKKPSPPKHIVSIRFVLSVVRRCFKIYSSKRAVKSGEYSIYLSYVVYHSAS